MLIFVSAFEPGYKAGGPIKSVVELVDGLPPTVEATIVTSDRDLGDTARYSTIGTRAVRRGVHQVHYVDVRDPRQWFSVCNQVRRTQYDLLYVNSVWSPAFSMLPVLLKHARVLRARALLIAPRGELSPGALSIRGRKKRRVLAVWQPLLRLARPHFHASTEMEAAEVGRVLPWAHTLVAINSRGPEPLPAPAAPQGTVKFIFLSRISEKKNLAGLLDAVVGSTGPFELDIFGPIEDETYWQRCQAAIVQAPHQVQITYRGPVAPSDVQTTFAGYDAFVFPSLGENFGHVIAESLSAGCPVVCSRNTPWTPTLEAGGGTALPDVSAATIAAELTRRALLSDDARAAGRRDSIAAYMRWRSGVPTNSVVDLVLAEASSGGHER